MQTVKIKDIQPNENYRKIGNKASFAELVESVKAKGVIQPIVVTTIGGSLQVVAGRRRYNASIEAGLKDIPVVVKDGLTEEDILELAVIENTHREDPNPMDDALAFQKLFEMGKHTPDTLAKKMGKSVQYILGRMKLLNLPKDIQKMVSNETLSHGMAIQLTRLKAKEDFDSVMEELDNEWERYKER